MRSANACLAVVLAISAVSPHMAFAQRYHLSEKAERAWSLLKKKDYQRALIISEAAVSENPGDPVALAVRGNAYQYTGDFQRAKADHDLVLQMTPRDAGALTNSCWVRAVGNMELDLALTYCDQAILRSRSRTFAAYDARGFLHLRRGEFALALGDYDAALSDHKKLASSLFGRGIAKLRLGSDAEGRADLAAALKLEPSIADDYENRGMKP